MRSRHLFLVALAATLAVAASAPSIARAEPCWKRVITDWSKNGAIDGKYSPHCLRQAMRNTPEDLRDYTSIIDDIQAALVDATGGGGNGPQFGTNQSGGTDGTGGGSNDAMGPTGPGAKSTGKGAKAVPNAGTPASAPGHSRSLPLPLLVLGCVLLASALAAASPPLIKRLNGRLSRLRPAAGSVRPPA
jgi:hypothetical protein